MRFFKIITFPIAKIAKSSFPLEGRQRPRKKEGKVVLTRETRARTVGVLADEVGASIPQVNYLIRKLGIRPVGRAGTLRLFDTASAERVREAIASMEARRTRKTEFVRLFAGAADTPAL